MNTLHINTNRVSHDYKHIEYHVDPDDDILWVYLNPFPRPCVTPELVEDIRALQRMLEVNNGSIPADGRLAPVRYHVLDSKTPGAFSLGGDRVLRKKLHQCHLSHHGQFQSADRDHFTGAR